MVSIEITQSQGSNRGKKRRDKKQDNNSKPKLEFMAIDRVKMHQDNTIINKEINKTIRKRYPNKNQISQ